MRATFGVGTARRRARTSRKAGATGERQQSPRRPQMRRVDGRKSENKSYQNLENQLQLISEALVLLTSEGDPCRSCSQVPHLLPSILPPPSEHNLVHIFTHQLVFSSTPVHRRKSCKMAACIFCKIIKGKCASNSSRSDTTGNPSTTPQARSLR